MATNRPKRTHEAYAQWQGQWFKALCPCGWQGVERLHREQAERDAAAHVARAGGA